MLYDRPYMRESYGPETRATSVVTKLIIACVAVFILQQVVAVFFPGLGGRSNRFFAEWFALSGANFKELKVWTIFSYSFLHSTASFFHILGNMLGLFFIGRAIEPFLGTQRFLLLYFGGVFLGGLVYLVFHFNGYNPVVGASAAVFALLAFFCLLRPEQPITLLLFFILPVTLKPKWVFWGSLVISAGGVLLYELPGKSVMAHSAHLGGMLAGILFFRFVHMGELPLPRRSNTTQVEVPEWFKKRHQTKRQISYSVNRSNREALQSEVDRILDKINESGFGSLDAEEKATLDRAREILKR